MPLDDKFNCEERLNSHISKVREPLFPILLLVFLKCENFPTHKGQSYEVLIVFTRGPSSNLVIFNITKKPTI